MSFAKIIILGNLGRDPEVRYTPQGTMNVTFTMAANGRKRDEKPTWYRVTCWDKHAERIVSLMEKGHVVKGKTLYVEGQFEVSTFTGNDGAERWTADVTMTDFQFVGGGQQSQQQQQAQSAPAYGGYGASDDEQTSLNDIPF